MVALMNRMGERSRQNSAMIGGNDADPDMGSAESAGHDPNTYDPTQGVGTSAWQQSLRMNAELRRRRGDH